ncbi:MAG TPA: hypothetical protein VFB58_08915 [Chloroflexota bacterium]|nr:hypothetical protein [Chloroflexota bacterium]
MQEAEGTAARFAQRLQNLDADMTSLQLELSRKGLIPMAMKTRRLIRATRNLLDANIAVLFPDDTAEVREDMHQLLDSADRQVELALREDYEFESIQQRLYMATAQGEYVVKTMVTALNELQSTHRL